MAEELAGKVAIVTGGATELGNAAGFLRTDISRRDKVQAQVEAEYR